MASHAREGHKAERREPRVIAAPADAPPQSPLDFALAFMRDDSKSDALRAGMAKAALPYLHAREAARESGREEAPKPPFDLSDPYGSLRVEWRDALERAGLVPAASARETVHAAGTTSVPQPLLPPLQGRVAASETSGRVGFAREAPHPPRYRSAPSPEGEGEERSRSRNEPASAPSSPEGEGEEKSPRDARSQLAKAEESASALERRAVAAEGRLREAEFRARDMEQRALAAEALIARGR